MENNYTTKNFITLSASLKCFIQFIIAAFLCHFMFRSASSIFDVYRYCSHVNVLRTTIFWIICGLYALVYISDIELSTLHRIDFLFINQAICLQQKVSNTLHPSFTHVYKTDSFLKVLNCEMVHHFSAVTDFFAILKRCFSPIFSYTLIMSA